MRARCPAVLLLLVVGSMGAWRALASVSASLDTSQIASGDTVQLTLEHDGRTSGQPDVTPLEQSFDILGTSSSTSIELINGSASEKTQVVLTLAPKSTGRLTIPSLSWDGEQTQPLSLTVTGPGPAAQPEASGAPSAAKVFIETSATPGRPYVQAAVHLTVRLFTSETLYHADLELPDSSDFVVKQLGSDENGAVERSGRSYQVVTRQYLLFPMHSGKLTLPGPVLDAEVAVSQQPRSSFGNSPFGGFFGGPAFGMLRTLHPVRLHGDPIVLSVRPRPAGAVGSYWLPARDVTLSGTWNPAKLTARAGDPLTLDVDLQATGLTAAQLPDLASLLNTPSGLKAYPDQPKLSDSTQGGELVGNRDQTIAFMADSPGHYTIPALTVSWWDTRANQPRTATLPARTLTILPPLGNTATATPAPPAPVAQPRPPAKASPHISSTAGARRSTPAHAPSEWQWISISLALVWLATLGAWLWSRRSRAVPQATQDGRPSGPGSTPARSPARRAAPDASKERAAFRIACEANDAHAARAHLLSWAAALSGTAPAGINAIAARINDAGIVELLRDLDRACYAGGNWKGQALAAALIDLPARLPNTSRQRDGLAPLYP
ncbi:MAG TPA: BatD family protein [Steroidobacteraceae bacterium]